MTLLLATSFFDDRNKWMGYILASDKVVIEGTDTNAIRDKTKRIDEFKHEKVFVGRNYIGLFSGALIMAQGYTQGLESLDNQFNDLTKKSRYDRLGKVAGTKDVTLLIAKRTKGNVELYALNKHEGLWKPQVLHKGDTNAYRNHTTTTWWGPSDQRFIRDASEERLSPTQAQILTRDLFYGLNQSGEIPYDLGEPQLYYIAPNQHGRIRGRKLEPIRG